MSQRLRDAVAAVPDFHKRTGTDQLRFFAWVLHDDGKDHIKPADFTACFTAVSLPVPSNIHRDLKSLEDQKHLLKSKAGYQLSLPQRQALGEKYGKRRVTVQLHKKLEELPAKLADADQREYLDEALKCLRAEAWRGAVIMAWNQAYDHLCKHIVAKRLHDFNTVSTRWRDPVTITLRSDLRELREAQVLDVCRIAVITDKTLSKLLKSRLDERNDAAHPSGRKFGQSQAEAFVEDVVENVVLNAALPV